MSLAVITVVATFAFSSQSDFQNSVGINNVTQEVALVVRQAQRYGINSRGSNLDSVITEFSHGISFERGERTFNLFRDVDNDNEFDSSELLEEYTLPDSMEVSDLCVTNSQITEGSCPDGSRSNLTIIYTRPNPEAFFHTNSGSSLSGARAGIIIEETTGPSHRAVVVGTAGFIATR